MEKLEFEKEKGKLGQTIDMLCLILSSLPSFYVNYVKKSKNNVIIENK